MSSEPSSPDVPPWKFGVAVALMLVAVTLGTLFWMWRDTRPRRRPAVLGAPEPTQVQTNLPAAR